MKQNFDAANPIAPTSAATGGVVATPDGPVVTPDASTGSSLSSTLSNIGKLPNADLTPKGFPVQPITSGTGQPTSAGSSSQMGPPAPTDLDKLNQNFDNMRAIEATTAKAAMVKNAADQAQYKEQERTILQAEVDSKKLKDKFDVDYSQKMQDYQKSVDDYKEAAGEKVFPGRILADQTTGQKVQTGIAMALSAYGGALSGQDSMAMKVINTAIDNDINAQKFNIENKLKGARAGIDASQYIFSQMKEKFKDDEISTMATRNAMLDIAKTKILAAATKFDTTLLVGRAQQAAGQITLQQTTLNIAMKKEMANQALLVSLNGGSSNGSKPVDEKTADANRPRDVSVSQIAAMRDSGQKTVSDSAESYIPGYGMAKVGGKESRDKALEYLKERGPAIKDFDRISELQQDYNKVTDQATRRKIESDLNSLKAKLKKGALLETNRFSPEIIDFIDTFVGKPNSYLTNDKWQKEKFEEARGSLVRDIDTRMKDLSYPSYNPDFKVNSYDALKAARNKK